jgi:hypothetical protein
MLRFQALGLRVNSSSSPEPEVLVKFDVTAMSLLARRRCLSLSPVSLISQTQRRFDIL